MGRRTSLTPELKERLLSLVRKGNYIETACNVAGVHKGTFYDWMKRGETGEEPYASFREDFFRADGEAEAQVLGVIDSASKEQWQAAAWKAERRWPDRWARRERSQVEVTGKDGGDIKVTLDDIAEAMSAITKNAVSNPDPELGGDSGVDGGDALDSGSD